MHNEPFFSRGQCASVLRQSRVSAPARGIAKSLHGRVIIGLLAFAIEEAHGDPAYLAARLTVDMYRLPDFTPMTVETRVVRGGYRIKVIDAEVFSGGVSVGRATSQFLRRTENPLGQVSDATNLETRRGQQRRRPEPAGRPASCSALGGMWERSVGRL